MTSAEYLLKKALDLETPQRLTEGTGMTFHPPSHGVAQEGIRDALTRNPIKPGFVESAMPWVQNAGYAASMASGLFQKQPAPATTVPRPSIRPAPRLRIR